MESRSLIWPSSPSTLQATPRAGSVGPAVYALDVRALAYRRVRFFRFPVRERAPTPAPGRIVEQRPAERTVPKMLASVLAMQDAPRRRLPGSLGERSSHRVRGS